MRSSSSRPVEGISSQNRVHPERQDISRVVLKSRAVGKVGGLPAGVRVRYLPSDETLWSPISAHEADDVECQGPHRM